MQKLNTYKDPDLSYLASAVLLFAISMIMVFFDISVSDVVFVSNFFASLGSFAIFVFQSISSAAHQGRQRIALNTLPNVPPPLEATPPGLFDPASIPRVQLPAPKMARGVTNFFDNQKTMGEHFAYLEAINRQAAAALPAAVQRYSADREQLEDQQIVLFRMAHQAAKFAARFEAAFPNIKSVLTDVPQPELPSLPALPSILAALDYEKRTSQLEKGSANALARAGLEGARGNLLLAGTAAVAIVAINVIQFQKMVRQMQDDHGKVTTFAARAAADLEELGRAHLDIVTVSRVVHEQSVALHGLLVWADQQSKANGIAAPGSEPAIQENIRALKGYSLLSRLQAARAV